MLHLKPLATCRSSTSLKRLDRLKQCHCLQFAQCASLVSCIFLSCFKRSFLYFKEVPYAISKIVKLLYTKPYRNIIIHDVLLQVHKHQSRWRCMAMSRRSVLLAALTTENEIDVWLLTEAVSNKVVAIK